MSKFSRRTMVRATLLTAAATALAACNKVNPLGQGSAGSPGSQGPNAGANAPSSQPVTINYWDWWVTQGPTIDNEIKLFQQKNPNVTVQKTTQVVDQYPNLLQLAMKAQTSPDVFLIPSAPTVIEQIDQQWLKPLDQWATPKWQAEFPPLSFAEGSNVFQGKVYSAPYDGPAPWLQLYINNKLFKQAGLVDSNGKVKTPQTWSDVQTAAQAITKAGQGGVGWGFGDKQKTVLPWQMMLCQTSGTPDAQGAFDLRTGTYTWASNPVFLDWIKFFMGMKTAGLITPDAISMDDETARVNFAIGKFAMIIGGVWNQSGWTKTNPDFTDYSVVALPHQGATPTSYFYTSPGGTDFAVSNQTKLSDAAWQWFSWLNSKPAAIRWVQAGQGLRIFPDANKLEYAKTEPYREYMRAALDGIRMAPSPGLQHPTMSLVKPQTTLPDIQGILEGIYTGQIQDWKGALQDLEKRENAAQAAAIQDAKSRGIDVNPSWWRVPDWNLTQNYVQKTQK
ncbi:MAG TPA: extracellular solute-binding protein [Chloroflexota bacterium]|nr:extracellular solute-binding protein [Chloroflexota bacterium]